MLQGRPWRPVTRLRVGVIGCGAVAQIMHLPHLQELDHLFELAAMADVDPRVLEAVGRQYPGAERFQDHLQLLGQPLDALLVLTPGSHAPLAIQAARAGKHLFVEKPMCYTLDEAEQIRRAVEQAGVTLMVGYMKRYDPGYRYARELVGAMSDIRYVEARTLHPMSEWYWLHQRIRRGPGFEPVRLPRDRGEGSGGQSPVRDPEAELIRQALGGRSDPVLVQAFNVLVGSMVHDINCLRGLFGRPARAVSTEIWRQGTSITTVLEFRPEFRCLYTWTYLPELRRYEEDIAVYGSDRRVKIRFPSPFLRSEPTPVVVEGMEGEAAYEKTVTVSYEEAFRLELEHFHQAVTEGREPLTGWADAAEDLETIGAILRAYLEGRAAPL